jgi:hypothetical protein
MKKYYVLILLIIGFISCGEKKVEEVKVDPSQALVDLKKLPKQVESSFEATEILKDWTEYNALNSALKKMYSAETKEDLVVVLEDLIEKQKLLETSTYPELFDRPDIKSRQKVFKTYVLKIKSNIEFDINPREAVIEMINAYNAFNNQFSIVIKSNLDPKILFDE